MKADRTVTVFFVDGKSVWGNLVVTVKEVDVSCMGVEREGTGL